MDPQRGSKVPDEHHSGPTAEHRPGDEPIDINPSPAQFSIYVLPPTMPAEAEPWPADRPVVLTIEPERVEVERGAVRHVSVQPARAGFWSRLWTRFFASKVRVSVRQPDGTTVERRVSTRLSERMQSAAKVERAAMRVVTAHILGLNGRIRQETLKVGEDVGLRTVHKFLDEQTHCLYAMDLLEKGVRTRAFMPKDAWDRTCEDMRAKGLL